MSVHDKVVARESAIHGRGVFAVRRIRRGSYIGTFEGRETKEDGTYVLWLTDEEGNETGIRGENELRYLNHSKTPNTEFEGADLYATRNIQVGHELTLDYGEAWDDVD